MMCLLCFCLSCFCCDSGDKLDGLDAAITDVYGCLLHAVGGHDSPRQQWRPTPEMATVQSGTLWFPNNGGAFSEATCTLSVHAPQHLHVFIYAVKRRSSKERRPKVRRHKKVFGGYLGRSSAFLLHHRYKNQVKCDQNKHHILVYSNSSSHPVMKHVFMQG